MATNRLDVPGKARPRGSVIKELTPEHQAFIRQCITEFGTSEEYKIAHWGFKVKKGKEVERLLVLTPFRILIVKYGRASKSVQRSAHLYSLHRCTVRNDEMLLDFGDWRITFKSSTGFVERFAVALWDAVSAITRGFPSDVKCSIDGFVGSKLYSNDMLGRDHPVPKGTPDDIFLHTFRAYCAYYGVDAPSSVATALTRLLASPARVLDVNALEFDSEQAPTLFAALMQTMEYSQCFDTISVRNVPLGDEALGSLVGVLEMNKSVKCIRLHNVGASKAETVQLLSAVFQRNRTLSMLDLSENAFLDKGIVDVVTALSKRPLVYLNVDGFKSSAKGLGNAMDVLKFAPLGRTLQQLDLSNNRVSVNVCVQLAAWLADKANVCRALSLSQCGMGNPEAKVFLDGLLKSKAKALEDLNLSRNEFTDEAGLILSQLLARTPELCSLNFSHLRLSPAVVECVIAAMVKAPDRGGRLVSINASGINIGSFVGIKIASLFWRTTNLHSLRLNDCSLGLLGTQWLALALTAHPSLQLLHLDRNVLKTEWTVYTTGAAAASAPGFSEQNLSAFALAPSALLSSEARSTRQASLSTSKPLPWASASPPEQTNVQPHLLSVALARLVSRTPSLRDLSLAGNPSAQYITDVTALLTHLGKVKDEGASGLQRLDISGNMCGPLSNGAGMLALVAAINNLHSLRELYIDQNGIALNDLTTIVTAIRTHKALIKVPFPYRDFAVRNRTATERDGNVKKTLDRCKTTIADSCRRNLQRAEQAPVVNRASSQATEEKS